MKLRILLTTLLFSIVLTSFAVAAEIDIGLRVNNGVIGSPVIVKIAVEENSTSPLKITKNGIVYGIVLVPETDYAATKVKVKLADGTVKAWKNLEATAPAAPPPPDPTPQIVGSCEATRFSYPPGGEFYYGVNGLCDASSGYGNTLAWDTNNALSTNPSLAVQFFKVDLDTVCGTDNWTVEWVNLSTSNYKLNFTCQ